MGTNEKTSMRSNFHRFIDNKNNTTSINIHYLPILQTHTKHRFGHTFIEKKTVETKNSNDEREFYSKLPIHEAEIPILSENVSYSSKLICLKMKPKKYSFLNSNTMYINYMDDRNGHS